MYNFKNRKFMRRKRLIYEIKINFKEKVINYRKNVFCKIIKYNFFRCPYSKFTRKLNINEV